MARASGSRDAGEKRRAYAGPALFSFGFRPFFLFAALFAGLAVPAWMGAFAHGQVLGPGGDAMGWHAHEMLFGFTGAVIAGFLLTAIPNWTGRAPVMGWPLALLSGLWLAGRGAMLLPDPGAGGRAVEALFLLVLAAAVWREILAGANWRNLPVAGLLSAFALANLLWHSEAMGLALDGLGQRLALSALILLMALIGGRIIPSFTTNWMKKERLAPLPTPFGAFDKAVLGLTGAALAGFLVMPGKGPVGLLLVAAGLAHLARLLRWRGWQTGREPLVLILHIAYLWLAVALMLIGAAALQPGLFAGASALHALTAGAVGQLTLAVMTRATRGHSGRPLAADTVTVLIYGLIFLGALLRLVLPFTPVSYTLGASIAGLFWAGGMLLFALAYGPMLALPRPAEVRPRA
jgi:uncharacterized protein involved in response to NO